MIVALKKKVHTKCRSVWKYASQEKCNNECSMCITVEFFCVGGGMGGWPLGTGDAKTTFGEEKA